MADSEGLVESPEKITAPEPGELPEGFVSTCQEDIYDTVLIPYGVTEKEQDNYVLTSYVNDTNRENAETLMEYGTDGFVSNVYEYGRLRNSISHYGEREYYGYDARGSVTGLTDVEGNTTASYSYDVFGRQESEGEAVNPYGYNGEYTDYNTGFQYLRARYYRPEEGRFQTEDSYEGEEDTPLSQNLYIYAGNNPVNVIDPSGHSWNSFWKKVKKAGKKVVKKAKGLWDKANNWLPGEFKSKVDDGGNPDFFKIKPVKKPKYSYTPSRKQYFPFTPESEMRNGAPVYKKGQSQEWKIRNVYSNKKYQTLVYKPQKAKKKKVNHANDRVIYLGMEMSRAEAERTKKFCDDAAYTAKEGVTAGTVAIGAAAIYSSGLGEVLTVAGAVIATTSTIAHGANVQEQVSGNNFLKDLVFDGDQKSYEKFQMGLALAEGAVAIAAISAQAKNNLKTKINNRIDYDALERETIHKTVGEKIKGYTKHGLNQAIGRDGGKGVSPEAILDTVRNPQKVIKQTSKYGPTYKYVSKKAVVVLNKNGKIVTTYAKGSKWTRGGK